MFRWLKAKAQKASVDAMRDDLQRFTLSLQGASSNEAGDVLVMATLVRLQLENSGDFDASTLNLPAYGGSLDEDLIPLKINRLIADLQKQGKKELAAGAMVWLHTTRVIRNPELRLLGRAMWKELERGSQSIDQQNIEEGIRLGHFPNDMEAQLKYIPEGLEPEIS